MKRFVVAMMLGILATLTMTTVALASQPPIFIESISVRYSRTTAPSRSIAPRRTVGTMSQPPIFVE